VTPAHIVPEWYFLPFYAILRAIPDKLGGVLAMGGAIAILAFLPWIDTSKVKSMTYRPIARQFFWVRPGLHRPRLSRRHAGRRPYVIASRILTVLYFGFFLALALIGIFETAKAPLPTSIADCQVLGGSQGRLGRSPRATLPPPNRRPRADETMSNDVPPPVARWPRHRPCACMAASPAAWPPKSAPSRRRRAGPSPARSASSTGRSSSAASRSPRKSAPAATR
jgi:hypothetical protein